MRMMLWRTGHRNSSNITYSDHHSPYGCSILISKEITSDDVVIYHKLHQTVSFSKCNRTSSNTSGLSSHQYWQFCPLTRSLNKHLPGLERWFFGQNQDRSPSAQGPSQQIFDAICTHLILVLASIRVYKDVVPDPYAIFSQLGSEIY